MRRRRRGRETAQIVGYRSSRPPTEEIYVRNSNATEGEQRRRFIRLGQLGMPAVRSRYARHTITVSRGNESTETTAKSVKRYPLISCQKSHVRHETRAARFPQANERAHVHRVFRVVYRSYVLRRIRTLTWKGRNQLELDAKAETVDYYLRYLLLIGFCQGMNSPLKS